MNAIILIIILIEKKPIHADYSVLSKDLSHKSPRFKAGDRVTITKYKNIFSKVYAEKYSKEMLVVGSVSNTNPWTYKIKDLKRETIIGSFHEKESLLSKL